MNVKRVCKVGDSVRDIEEGRDWAANSFDDFGILPFNGVCIFHSL